MNAKVRHAIFNQYDLFRPGSNMGLSVESLMLSSSELESLEPEDIEEELDAMAADGLVNSEQFLGGGSLPKWWSSTTKGQVELQKRIVALGSRPEALSKQAHFDASDLVLALVAAPSISQGSGSNMRRDLVPIFLFDRDPKELDGALTALIQDTCIRSWDTPWGAELSVTVKGLKRYKSVIHKRLDLKDGESLLVSRSLPAADPRFAKLSIDATLASNLETRWTEALQSREVGAVLGSVILLGSVLEGILLAVLKKDIPRALRSARAPRDRTAHPIPIEDWKLSALIDVAADLGLVTTAATKHAHELRDSRNLIHPQKQIDDGIEVDHGLVDVSFDVVNAVLNSLVKNLSP